MNESILDVLKNTTIAKQYSLSDEVITDTIDEVGSKEVTTMVRMLFELPPELSRLLIEPELQAFFKKAIERQKLRNHWEWAMDPSDPMDMFVNEHGEFVFKEVK